MKRRQQSCERVIKKVIYSCMTSVTSAHSGSQHDRSVLLKHSLLLLLKAGDSEPMDLEASLNHTHIRTCWENGRTEIQVTHYNSGCSNNNEVLLEGFDLLFTVTFPMKRDRKLEYVTFSKLSSSICSRCVSSAFCGVLMRRRHKPAAADRKHRKRISWCL